MNFRSSSSLSILEAVGQAPGLQRLSEQMSASSRRLDLVRPVLPPGLRQAVAAGPCDEQGWCLLVSHQAAAAKLRQMLPVLLQTLEQAGQPVSQIRIRVRSQTP